jgi:hypothetical protein
MTLCDDTGSRMKTRAGKPRERERGCTGREHEKAGATLTTETLRLRDGAVQRGQGRGAREARWAAQRGLGHKGRCCCLKVRWCYGKEKEEAKGQRQTGARWQGAPERQRHGVARTTKQGEVNVYSCSCGA